MMADLKDFSEQFEAWWLTKFSAEFLDSDNCWSAWTGWQARGELDVVRIKELEADLDKFHEWVESQSPLALREYIHAQAAWQARGELDVVRNACIKALEPTVGELNDEYLRDTHVEGMPKAETQHWLCLDGQMVVAQLYNLVEILNDPMKAYPHNFSTPAKANALLFGLCQEAADEIERLKAETQEPVAWFITNEYGNNDCAIIDSEKADHFKARGDCILEPLYTTPSREWQSLSDEEINLIYPCTGGEHDFKDIARAIEKALKEKNG
jgi:hypothetical protein